MSHKKHGRVSSSSSESSSSGSEAESVTTPASKLSKLPETEKKRRRDVALSSSSSSDSDSATQSFTEHHHHKSKTKSKHHGSEKESKKIKKTKIEESPKAPSIPLTLFSTTELSTAATKPSDTKTHTSKQTEIVSNTSPSALPQVSDSALFAEVLCEFADFATCLAQKISLKVGYPWTPQLLREREVKKIKKPVKDPNEPKRPQSSYTLWCDNVRKKVKEHQPERTLKMAELAEMWKSLSPDQKSKWDQAAKVERDHYAKEMEVYRANQAHKDSSDTTPNGK